MQIKVFEGDYDKTEFYGYMGKYFAEPSYRKEMPYLVNRETNTWFLVLENGKLVAFAAVRELKSKVILEHSYVEKGRRNSGLWKDLNRKRFDYARKKEKPMEVVTKEDHLIQYWIKNGFDPYRQNGRYTYLRRDDGGNNKAKN